MSARAAGADAANANERGDTTGPSGEGRRDRVARGVLVVGYGNRLRSDDGVGPVVAERVAADGRLIGVQVRAVHQLTPELALDASQAALLVLVDADQGVQPGQVAVRALAVPAEEESSSDGPTTPSFTHHVDPAALLRLAGGLWGSTPRTVVVGVGPGSLELGDRLSPEVEAAVPRVAEAVVAVIEAVEGRLGEGSAVRGERD